MLTGLKLALIQNWYSKGRNDADLARRLEIDKGLLSRWINGQAEAPLQRKLQIAEILGLDSRVIFPDQEDHGRLD